MAAGPAKILYPDDLGMGPFQYQLLKSQSIAQTAITAAKLSQNLEDVSFDEDTVEFLEVQRYSAIRCQVWGVAADTNAPVINLYGWPASGPGQRLAVMTLAYGPFVSEDAANVAPGWHAGANAHLSIKKGFDRNIDYRGCDTYTMTTEFGAENIIETGPLYYQAYRPVISPRLLTDAIPIADFPSYFTVDFSRSNYAYFGVLVTTLSGTTLGAIFQPLAYRNRLSR